jgi:hypothetical protein
MIYGYRALAVAVVALAAVATAYWAFRGGASGDTAPACRTEERGGFTVVRVRGTPRAKGRALGAALEPSIRAELERALPADAGTREFVVSTGGEKLAPFLTPEIREEIEGIAEGARITFDEALFLSTRFELAAHHLAPGEGDLPAEGAVGPGPAAGALFAEGKERDLVVVVHEDRDPPLWLVARPGMAGGFLGLRGNVAAAMRPKRSDTPPGLHGLVWTLVLRRLLEAPASWPEATGGVSIAMALPDGGAGTLNFAAWGATWYPADGARSLTTDEPVGERGAPSPRREPDARAQVAEGAVRLLDGPPAPGRVLVGLRAEGGVRLVVAGPGGRREIPLD